MTATSTENHAPPTHAPDATGRRSPLNDDPIVLLLYGEEHVNLALADELALDGYEVRRASDTAKLRAVCSEWEVELVIFGRATRRGAGLDVLRKLRAGAFMPEAKRGLRALWMTPNGDLGDVLRGFEAGADDVLRPPFAYPELRARVQALVRRDLGEGPCVIEYGELRIDTAAHEVTIGPTPVELRRLEYALLVYLARDPGRVYTKDELLREVWGFRLPGVWLGACDFGAGALARPRTLHLGTAGDPRQAGFGMTLGVGHLVIEIIRVPTDDQKTLEIRGQLAVAIRRLWPHTNVVVWPPATVLSRSEVSQLGRLIERSPTALT